MAAAATTCLDVVGNVGFDGFPDAKARAGEDAIGHRDVETKLEEVC